MDSDRHARIKRLFLEICDLPRDQCAAVIARACGDDDEMRREIESLLGFHDRFETGLPEGALGEPPTAPSEPAPERIGKYRVVRKLGEGGMGIVYEVRQDGPIRRRLALKVVKWGMDTSDVLVRFESERQALAMMEHPNVAKVIDVGATEQGRPFFTMEFVEGEPINLYSDRNCLTTSERIELFLQVCEGVQHAHRKGIIHRDIKSSNLLVCLRDGRPVPVIIDFGVAKATQQRLTERSLYTERGMLIGTPEYMSPEQAEMTGLDVDTRTDVYSLGVVLYELLVGALPFDSRTLREAGFDEIRRRIREETPSKPSTRVSTLGDASTEAARRRRTDPESLRRELSGDMDWIVMMALEKDRTRRYESPAEMAADIARYLRHEPVLAGPPGATYRLRKFVRRHRTGVVASAVVLLALIAGLALSVSGLVRARAAERVATAEAARANKVLDLLSGLFDSMNAGVPGYASSREQVLDLGVDRIERQLAGEPELQARLLAYVAGSYGSIGKSEKARDLAERSLALCREHLPPDHPILGASLNFLGDIEAAFGNLEQARQLHEEALGVWNRVLQPGQVSVSLGRTYLSLGSIRQRQGDLEGARSHLDRAHEILERYSGPLQIHLAYTLTWEAILDSEGDLHHEAAVPRLEQALAILEREFGPDHPRVGDTLFWLGRIHRRLGDAETARLYYERALDLQVRAGGEDGYATARTRVGLAEILVDAGQSEPARELLEPALEILEAAEGAPYQDADWCARRLADAHLQTGDVEAARLVLERSLREFERRVGKDHPSLTRTMHQLGYVALRAGNLDRAREWYRTALEVMEKTWPPEHRVHRWAWYRLGAVAALEGRNEEALGLLRRAVDCGFDDPEILEDPDLAGLRGDPRMKEIVAEVRARLERGQAAAR